MTSTFLSAHLGEAATQNDLGWMYEDGKEVAQDYIQAVYWYTKARVQFTHEAEKGSKYAQYYLGKMYYEGKGVAKDDKQAAYWLGKAADWLVGANQGHEDAKEALKKLGAK